MVIVSADRNTYLKRGVLMAEKDDKWHDNVGGLTIIAGKKVSFYVDYECILCSVCSDAAPNNFKTPRYNLML